MEFDVAKWRSAAVQRDGFAIGQPTHVGCWTKDSDTAGGGIRYGDHSGAGRYQPPQLPADLNEGYPARYIAKKEDLPVPVERVLSAFQHSAPSALQHGSRTNIVTFRNNLNKIFLTPKFQKDAWAVDACWIDSTLFLDIVKLEGSGTYDNAELYSYYGYKFEALCTGCDVVDATSEYCVLVDVALPKLRLLFAAEVDTYRHNDGGERGASNVSRAAAPRASQLIELKTYRMPRSQHAKRSLYNVKFAKWWIQSFMAGVPTIAAGEWDDNGVLHRITEYSTSQLPSIARQQAAGCWNAWELLHFGNDVLSWMVQCAAQHPEQHLSFRYNPGNAAIVCTTAPQPSLPARLRAALAQHSTKSIPQAAKTVQQDDDGDDESDVMHRSKLQKLGGGYVA